MNRDGSFARRDLTPVLIATAIFAGLSLWAAITSQGFLEADACTHYLYARFALDEPHYFVNVWGRPLCTALYALPAAYAGRIGVRITSLLLALACATIAYRIARGQQYRWPALAFVFTLAQPLVFLHSFSELTELPFATLIGLAFWMYQKRCWGAMAMLAGLSPLGRPEGFGFVLMTAAALILHRRAVWLLALPLPLVLWNHAGWVMYGRQGPWWMWLGDNWPYAAESLYASGHLVHFLVLLPVVTSPILFPAMVIGVWQSLGATAWVRDHRQRCQALIALIPLTILVAHSILYWLGKMASNGELRYMLVAAPFWGLLAAKGWQWVFEEMRWRAPLRWAAVAALVPIGANFAWRVVPIQLYDNDLLGQRVAQWYRDDPDLSHDYPRVIAASPTIYYALDISITSRQRSLEMNRRNVASPPQGTFLVWDPVFGPYNSDEARVVTRANVESAGWIPLRTFHYAGKTWETFLSPLRVDGRPTDLHARR